MPHIFLSLAPVKALHHLLARLSVCGFCPVCMLCCPVCFLLQINMIPMPGLLHFLRLKLYNTPLLCYCPSSALLQFMLLPIIPGLKALKSFQFPGLNSYGDAPAALNLFSLMSLALFFGNSLH